VRAAGGEFDAELCAKPSQVTGAGVPVGFQECHGEVVAACAFEIGGAAVLGRERLQLRAFQEHDQRQLVPVAGGSIELTRERIQEEIGLGNDPHAAATP